MVLLVFSGGYQPRWSGPACCYCAFEIDDGVQIETISNPKCPLRSLVSAPTLDLIHDKDPKISHILASS